MTSPSIGSDETLDSIFTGKLRLIQKRQGYRFSMDAVILARSVTTKRGEKVLDLGTGCGIIPVILALTSDCGPITGIEVQPELAELAGRNVLLNKYGDRIDILNMDLKKIRGRFEAGSFDVVVTNPPFGTPGTGRISPYPQKAMARHEIMASLEHVLDAAEYALRLGGRMYLIYPAPRLARLIHDLKERNLEPKWLRMVHAYRNSEAQLAVIHALKGGGEELLVMNPLYMYEENGRYTLEMEEIYSP